jgi:hypothetical protein
MQIYIGKEGGLPQPFLLGEMSETLVCIRHFVQKAALPVAVDSATRRYTVINICGVEVLVALFGFHVHPCGAIGHFGVGLDVKAHLLPAADKDIVNSDVRIHIVTADATCADSLPVSLPRRAWERAISPNG